MKTMNTNIVPKASIEELCLHRASAIEGYDQVREAMQRTSKAVKRMNLTQSYNPVGLYLCNSGNRGYSREIFIKDLDAALWRHALEALGMDKLMGAKQKMEFRNQLEGEPPAFEVETVYATISGWTAGAADTFEQSVMDCWDNLSHGFKSNDGLFGERAIYDYAVRYCEFTDFYSWTYGTSWRTSVRDKLHDLERIFSILDRQPLEIHTVDLVNENFRSKAEGKAQTFTGPYFRLKWFKKGTLHIHFTRPDLIDQVNEIIARRSNRVEAAA